MSLFLRSLKVSRKNNIPFIFFIISYNHLKKVLKKIPLKSIDSIISEENIIITVDKKMKKKGSIKGNKIKVKYEKNNLEYEEVLFHELFHYFENKFNIQKNQIISETAARIFSSLYS
ncbi:MAG: hypothetical protein ACQESP_00155 [Candidatus Muiribacteriota bacterium]